MPNYSVVELIPVLGVCVMLNKEQETLFEIIESDKNILLFSELGVKVIEVLLLFEVNKSK
jgi:hypothetical protein